MSFIHIEDIKKLLSSGAGVDFSVDLKIGDTVNLETVSLLIESPLDESADLLQKDEAFCFVENDIGETFPCYITFSREKALWVFRGACYEDSIINRCGGLQFAPQTIGDYCVDKFNDAYIKALKALYSEGSNALCGDIDDYIKHDAQTTAGYLISKYGDEILPVFLEKGAELCSEGLYYFVADLLKHKDDIYMEESFVI